MTPTPHRFPHPCIPVYARGHGTNVPQIPRAHSAQNYLLVEIAPFNFCNSLLWLSFTHRGAPTGDDAQVPNTLQWCLYEGPTDLRAWEEIVWRVSIIGTEGSSKNRTQGQTGPLRRIPDAVHSPCWKHLFNISKLLSKLGQCLISQQRQIYMLWLYFKGQSSEVSPVSLLPNLLEGSIHMPNKTRIWEWLE